MSTFKVTDSTMGQANPRMFASKPYRYRGTPGWNPAAAPADDDGPSTKDRRPSARAARLAAYSQARDEGYPVPAAAREAGITAKTALRYEAARNAGQEPKP